MVPLTPTCYAAAPGERPVHDPLRNSDGSIVYWFAQQTFYKDGVQWRVFFCRYCHTLACRPASEVVG